MPLFGGLKKLLVRIGADTTELDKKLTESSRRIEKVGRRLDRMGRSLSLNVTAPILALGTASVVSSIRFEDAMAGVAKTVDESAETIAALGDEFKALSEDIPVAATELASIGEAAGQLGIATSNILSFSRVMADLGVATNLTSTEAATDLARLANITGMPQDSFDRLGSTVVALGNNLATTEREIVSMGLRLAGAGAQLGLTEAQILALAGSLSSVGIEVESGGTAISEVMAQMAIAIGEGGDKLDQFGQIAGMSGEAFAEAFEADAADTLVTFIEGLGRLSEEGVNVFQVLESVEFGNRRVRDALLRASSAGDLMRRSLDLGSTAWRENTALTIEAEKFYATLGNQLKTAWNEVVNMAAELGDQLKPALLAVVDASKPLLGFIRDAIKGFSELPNGIQATAIGLVALTVAVGPLLVMIVRLTIAVGMLRGAAALGGLSTMLVPGGAILVALAALAAGFLLAKSGADKAAESVARLQSQLASFSEGLAEKSGEALQALEQDIQRQLADAQAAQRRFARAGAAARGTNLFENLNRQFSEATDRVGQLQSALARLREEMEQRITLPGVSTGAGAPTPTFDFGDDADDVRTLTDVLEDLNKEVRKADQLEASLGRSFDLVAAKVGIFRSALEEMIDLGIGPANEAYQELLDKLRRFIILQGEASEAAGDFGGKGPSFFGGLKDQAKSLLDPSAIVSTALGGVLSGAISSVLGGIGSALGGFFGFGGPSEELIANTEAVEKNIEAANRLSDNLNALSAATVGLPFDALAQALKEGERKRAEKRERISGIGVAARRAIVGFDESVLARFGLTMADVEAIAKGLGLDFDNLSRDAEALSLALENMNTFNRDFGLIQKQFALFDITDPAEKFSSVMDLLASQVSERFGAVLSELTPENFDAFLEMFRAGFADFDQTLLGDDVTFEQFLTAIGFAESALDGLATEVERATAAIRNAPAGFKVARGRFEATRLGPIGNRDPGDIPVPPPSRPPPDPGDISRSITVEGDIILQGVQDPREFLSKLEDEVQWRARTGTSVLQTTTRRR